MSVSRHPDGRHPAAEHGTISVDNLECKTIVMSFYSKLQRVTTSAFPHTIVQWRHLKFMKWHRFSHRLATALSPEELALFCLACPQLGFNLTEDWKTDPDHDRWKYMRGFVMDGNFSTEHLKMRNLWDDVVLTEGAQYMVSDTLYKQHLEEAKEAKERSTCSNHQVVNQANADQHNLEATSIGATACAKHGCFCLHAVVDFQKGERQMNMDYSLSGALKTLSDILQTLIMYDIMCQYGVHLCRWFAESQYLMMSEDLEIMKGISVWHIHGHQDQCFYSNWKKWIQIIPSICKKYVKVKAAFANSKEAFAELTLVTDARLLTKWSQQEDVAATSHQTNPEWLNIYDISKIKKIAIFNQEAIHYIREIEQAEEWEDISGNKIQDPMSDNEDDANGTPDPADNIGENTDEEDVAKSVIAKKICLSLPSTFSTDKCMELGLQALAKQELELWKGQVNDALHHICIHLGHKSFLFWTSVRQANS
ncbi:hypothetical protein EW146_g3670 [Bondarzewia mesenterica]|uniref:CxC2-like cysteine cluster KDZ transposase-associated domain-containing protein n=1 Tax=Bondarzewia mesenterica TaxID=1095465 RepID=A0A4S4LYB0_9AGAM|nr:hypothetical protein EW146_g3670 [Bondarzewia mesenterica]